MGSDDSAFVRFCCTALFLVVLFVMGLVLLVMD
jgi:hypothetical protein